MASITSDLARMLSTVQRPGDFHATGTIEIFTPRLEVEGVGPIALPLLPVQAEQLIAVAERAPYGRGEATVVDPEVRRTWQIGADRVRIQGRSWAQTLETIVARAAAGLGVSDPVDAELYKLLVYDEGSFFVGHRDTEKVSGMFATLVIALPSLCTGGDLVVRHKDREVRLDLRCPEPSDAAFAAFYADCVHEVLPVTAGCRLTLVYNLKRQGRGRLPEPPNYEAEQARVAALLRDWDAGRDHSDDDRPEKLIYPLEHAYTQAELSFAALKGADAAASAVLVAAAQQADCDVHLALVSIEENGAAEHTDYYRSRRRRSDEDDDDFEIIEVFERRATLSDWRRPDGSRSELGDFPFEEAELCPPGAFDDLEPDEQYFHEATGNEGASFERTYRRAALVLWPRDRRLAVLGQAGLAVTLPYLEELTGRWAGSGDGPESPLWREAHELSEHMLRSWPKQDWPRRRSEPQSDAGRMMTLLSRLKDTARIDAFLADISASGVYGKGDNEAVLRAVDLLPSERAAALIARIVTGNAAAALDACADLLARAAAAARTTGRRTDLVPAAAALVAVLPGDPARVPRPEFGRPSSADPGLIVDLLSALGRIDAALADAAAGHILAWPKTYGFDTVLVPALVRLTGQDASRDMPAVRRLRAACLEHLRARIAEPLEPPGDWTRAAVLTCKCPHCSDLGRFLTDPDRKVWILKAAEANRRHVELSVRQSGSDLDLATDRGGRPYSLVCTKNQASYDRRVQQRRKDLDNTARLGGAAGA